MPIPPVRPEALDAVVEQPALNEPDFPRRWFGDVALFVLILFVQLGVSYYASVAMLLAVLVLSRLHRQLFVGLRLRFWVVVLVPLMYLPLLAEYSADFTADATRIAREAVVLVLMGALFTGSALRPVPSAVPGLIRGMTLVALFVVGLVALQTLALRGGVYLGLPKELYAQGIGTIPDEKDLYYSKLRPAGTFSEPSYLGFVMLSMLLVGLAAYERHGRGMALIALALLAGAMSQSASFVLFSIPLVVLVMVRGARGGTKATLLVMLPIMGLLAYFAADTLGLLGRVQGGTDAGGDISIFVRVFGPMSALPDYLGSHIFGLPESRLSDALLKYVSPLGIDPFQFTMNALINFFFNYGVIGVFIATLLLWRRDIALTWFILAAMFFNGSFLAIDKLGIVCLTVALYHAIRASADERS